jgi:hypothetical protein
MMDKKLLNSLGALTREKHALGQRAEQLAKTERRLMGTLGRALATIGYRVVPLNGRAHAASRVSGAPKRLKCPKCDRRFAHPLPMSRHLAATHSAKPAARKAAVKAQRTSA